MKLINTIIGLLTFTNIFSQDFKRIESQFDLGTTMTIPYKKTVVTWPGAINGPQTDYNSNFGYFFEYMISYNMTNKIAIYSGLNYNFNRYGIVDKIGFMERKGNLTSSNVYFPVLFRYSFSDKVPLLLFTGPYLNLLINAREKGTLYIDTAEIVYFGEPDPAIESINPIQKYDNNITKEYPHFDFGLSAQLDYEFKLSEKIDGVIYTRFNYGIKRKTESDLVSVSTPTYWRNYTLMIGFGIKL